MNYFFRSVLLPLILFSCISCNENRKKTAQQTSDSIQTIPTLFPDSLQGFDSAEPITPSVQNEVLREGIHAFTLHWISWDRQGKVKIEAGNEGWYTVSGSQKDEKGNFITIEGELRVVLPTELRFRGIITERVELLNNGDTCIRKGEQVFLSTKNRKYWRLQNMANCEGSGVVDYIDIYY